jgi:2-polyprenyl-3-methyl-5-hydroxy-6-metoxy-1,4-benzoquinol methylase
MLERLMRLFIQKTDEISEFEKNNPLGFGGERVDFILDEKFDYSKLDIYQKNHYRRYEFAMKGILPGEICGDFACGSGYGSALLSTTASKVIGVDINKKVISEIKKRYRNNTKVEFFTQNLLGLDFQNYFSSIISFETIEHFYEKDICKLLSIFHKSLKKEGKIIISTPYLQEDSPAARKLGFHQTFNIDEERINLWFSKTDFVHPLFYFQDYKDHEITTLKNNPDFLICIAQKA